MTCLAVALLMPGSIAAQSLAVRFDTPVMRRDSRKISWSVTSVTARDASALQSNDASLKSCAWSKS
jgi:hypothetical protein